MHSRLTVGAPVYRIMDLLRYNPNMSKMDGFWVLASPWSLRGAGWLYRIEGFWGVNTPDSVEEIASRISEIYRYMLL